jgi:hypothetical protein
LVVLPISQLLARGLVERGEFVLIISGYRPISDFAGVPTAESIAAEFGLMTNAQGKTRRQALRALADTYELPARAIFDLLEEAKNLV